MSRADWYTDLEKALLRELMSTWHHLNRLHFRSGLKVPALTLKDGAGALGSWTPRDRTIAFARHLVVEHPWTVVVEVLKHEMAHQYVTEVLHVTDEASHGPAFHRVCRRVGLDPTASGLPQRPAATDDHAKLLGRIQRLLALSDSPNEHEAQAAARAAHKMMRKHNIAWAKETEAPAYGFTQVGTPRLRVPGHERFLAGLLADHYFVEAVWVPAWIPERLKRGRVLEISGTYANIEMAAYVHAFLLRSADDLWRDYLGADPTVDGSERPRYLVGVMLGFRDQLQAQAQECHETGLVWVGDPGLQDYVTRRHPRLRATRAVRYATTDAYRHGREAGRKIRLRQGVEAEERGPTPLLTGRE